MNTYKLKIYGTYSIITEKIIKNINQFDLNSLSYYYIKYPKSKSIEIFDNKNICLYYHRIDGTYYKHFYTKKKKCAFSKCNDGTIYAKDRILYTEYIREQQTKYKKKKLEKILTQN